MICLNCNKPHNNKVFCSIICHTSYKHKMWKCTRCEERGKPRPSKYSNVCSDCITASKYKVHDQCEWHLCNNPLVGKQRKYCSTNCKNKAHVSDFRRNLKIRAIQYKGGRCLRCNYDKCVGALHFHHIDDTKEFNISNCGSTKSWESIRTELDRCILVCANCHAEIHQETQKLANQRKLDITK